jgi:sortase B
MTSTHPKRAGPWPFLVVLCATALLALVLTTSSVTERAASVVPMPQARLPSLPAFAQSEVKTYVNTDDGFPTVDWGYWQEVNPAIVGWVSIPGTAIDYAVVQAPGDDPTYYLDHDIFGQWNPYGCPYVDASCDGLLGLATYVFGHNMGFGDSMFSDLANYSDAGYAKEHLTILVQTPTEKLALTVSAVDVVKGDDPSKRTDFAMQQDLAAWYAERYGQTDVRIEQRPEATRLFVLVTCSYNYFSNERTLVYAN